MFIIYHGNHHHPEYITGVEDIAKKYCEDNGKSFFYKEVPVLGKLPTDNAGLNELIEPLVPSEFDIATADVITPEQKQYILNQLGFAGRGKGLWWHRALGEDTQANRFHFSLPNTPLSMLPTALVVDGYNKFKNQFNTFLNEDTSSNWLRWGQG